MGVRIKADYWACSKGRCAATFDADCEISWLVREGDDVERAVRWIAPRATEFYDAGWAYKHGRTTGLTYCPLHAATVYRCSCQRKGGPVVHRSDTCFLHSGISDIRTTASDVLDPPERVSSLLEWTKLGPLAAKNAYSPDFVFRDCRWTFETQQTDTLALNVRWTSKPA